MKRIKITSRTPKTRVYFKLPQADPNKKYKLWVEKLTVPSIGSSSLEGALFEVERRLVPANHVTPTATPTYKLRLPSQYPTTFTCKNCRTPLDLLTQINTFLSELLLRVSTFVPSLAAHRGLQTVAGVNYSAASFQVPAGTTWNSVTDAGGLRDTISLALSATLSSRGKFGFRFSQEAVGLFVIRLTTEGRRVLGFPSDKEVICGDLDHFRYTRTVPVVQGPNYQITVAGGNPAAAPDAKIVEADISSLFSHVNYRQEIVLNTDLPFQTKISVLNSEGFYRKELSSYVLPQAHYRVSSQASQGNIVRTFTSHLEGNSIFETSTNTHNKYVLKGTDLQNFTLYLESRRLVLSEEGKWEEKVEPFPMNPGSYFTCRLTLMPL